MDDGVDLPGHRNRDHRDGAQRLVSGSQGARPARLHLASRGLGTQDADSFDPLTFWATEREALCSDLLAQPRGGFVPVRCCAARERGDTIQLWLEDIHESPGTV